VFQENSLGKEDETKPMCTKNKILEFYIKIYIILNFKNKWLKRTFTTMFLPDQTGRISCQN
jgi:hypothetical protein